MPLYKVDLFITVKGTQEIEVEAESPAEAERIVAQGDTIDWDRFLDKATYDFEADDVVEIDQDGTEAE